MPAKAKRAVARSHSNQPAASAESRAADFMTIGWLLSVITTLVCAVVVMVSWVLIEFLGLGAALALFADLLLFASVVIGLSSLGLLAVVLRTRQAAPPRLLVIASAVTALVPLALLSLKPMLTR